MPHPPLYEASVPVFLHFLDRIDGLLDKVRGREPLLAARLAPDMFPAGIQLATAMGFALRTACPLAGQPVPVTDAHPMDRIGLLRRAVAVRAALHALDPADFAGADLRRIEHLAGFAQLDQGGTEFLHLFGMPNFLFHVGMAFAILRANGVVIGKADFDGLHDYPHGFRF